MPAHLEQYRNVRKQIIVMPPVFAKKVTAPHIQSRGAPFLDQQGNLPEQSLGPPVVLNQQGNVPKQSYDPPSLANKVIYPNKILTMIFRNEVRYATHQSSRPPVLNQQGNLPNQSHAPPIFGNKVMDVCNTSKL